MPLENLLSFALIGDLNLLIYTSVYNKIYARGTFRLKQIMFGPVLDPVTIL